MKKIFFYSYPKCSTCIKAKRWLDHNNINYQFLDIVKEPPPKKSLELALIQFSSDKKKIFNTRGKSFKLINFDIKELSNERIIELLSNDGKLIKRPFLITPGNQCLVGFNELEYSVNFK